MRFGAFSAKLASFGIRVAMRPIANDEALFPDPTESMPRRRASGAARLAARDCLAALGGPVDESLPRTPRGFVKWPKGFVGSLAHDNEVAVALVARATDVVILGVDVEPVLTLPTDVVQIALSEFEQRSASAKPSLSRAIFAAKEAVYKAINPYDGTPLEYEDIEIRLDVGFAHLRDGRKLRLVFAENGHWIVAAFAPPSAFARRCF